MRLASLAPSPSYACAAPGWPERFGAFVKPGWEVSGARRPLFSARLRWRPPGQQSVPSRGRSAHLWKGPRGRTMSPSPPAPAALPPAAAASRGRGCERGAGGRDGRGAGRRGLQREPEPGACPRRQPRRHLLQAARSPQVQCRAAGTGIRGSVSGTWPPAGSRCRRPGTEGEAGPDPTRPFRSAPRAGRREDGASRGDVPRGPD